MQDARGEELGDGVARGAQQRAGEEQGEGGEPDALRAEAFARPAGERDDRGEGEQVDGRHPLDRRDARVEVRGECGKRDIDDRRVEDREDRAEHERGGDADGLGRPEAVVGLRHA